MLWPNNGDKKMKSSCCESRVTVMGDTTRYWVCDDCGQGCNLCYPYRKVEGWDKPKMTDDEALAEGIRVQNEKYAKLLAFVRKVNDGWTLNQTDIEALEMLSNYEEEAAALLEEIAE